MERPRARVLPSAFFGFLLGALTGCYASNSGPPPPPAQFYFPTGVAISPGGSALYLVNSDFDLQFTGGTVQVVDLRRLRAAVPRLWEDADCAHFGLPTNSPPGRTLYPGTCGALDPTSPPDGQGSLLRATVSIGAFVTDAVLATRPAAEKAAGARLLLPVRGDPSLTWIDVDDDRYEPQTFRLACNQGGSAARCGNDHRAGTNPAENTRAQTLPTEPFDLALNDRGDAIVVTHQTTGAVSLFRHGWGEAPATGRGACGQNPSRPELSFVLAGLPTGVTGVAALPTPRLVSLRPETPYKPTFLVTFRDTPQVTLVTVNDNCVAAPQEAFLTTSGSVPLRLAARGSDSRGVAVDARARQQCENACAATDTACLATCAAVPARLFVANRDPAALFVGETIPNVGALGSNDLVRFFDQIPLDNGVSRVQLGSIVDREGVARSRVFVLCFDAHLIYVIDPDRNAIEGIIRTGRGPSALAFDPAIRAATAGSAFGYITHFTDSYLGVVDLDQRHPATYLTLLATIGVPSPPRESR